MEHALLLIHGDMAEHVENIKFLSIHIIFDLTWSLHTSHLVKKAQQKLFFVLRKLKCAGLSSQLLTNLYKTTIQRILRLSVTVWYCTAQDRKDRTRVVRTAQESAGSPFPDLDSMYTGRV